MHPRAEEFAEEAGERYGVEIDVHEFEEGTKTAEDAASAIGCDVAQIASSLVFVADGEPVVVVTSGANRASEAKIADVLRASDVEMAGPEEVREATGWSIGGVPPFCHENDPTVLFDETLIEHEEVWAAAGTPAAVFPMAPDRIVEIAGARVADVAE